MSFIKKYCFIAVIILISICSFYSLGFFDKYLVFEDVYNKNYVFGGFSYTGQLKDGKFENIGFMELSNGSKIFAQFENGVFSGKFIYIDKDMLCFKGTYENGIITDGVFSNPKGDAVIKNTNNVVFSSTDGWSYTGKVNFNGQCGRGTFKYADGSIYEGEFLRGLANKKGTYYNENGDVVYSGDFYNGSFNFTKS